jgi:protein-tyrosine phosphatase
MAEYLMRRRLGTRSLWRVASAGLSTLDGQPASQEGIAVLAEKGIDMRPHRSRLLTRDLVDAASILVVMTASHSDLILGRYRDAREKVFLLRSFAPGGRAGDVEDPIGSPVTVYRATMETIDDALPGLQEFIQTLALK